MIYLSAENIEKNFGERVLFSSLSLGLEKGDKAALIAANGTGKTSLLNILAGKDEPEDGKVVLSESIRLSYLEQEPDFPNELKVKDLIKSHGTHVQSVKNEYEKALRLHSENNSHETEQRLAEASLRMDLAGAWDYERRLEEMLSRFAIRDTEQLIGELSGGQKKRLALSLVLLDSPDILLLDEPTNHLDIEMIEWLEEYLSRPGITFLMVTHDRYFLDRICTHIFELSNKNLYKHEGNYEYYLRKKSEREEAESIEIQKASKYVRNELDWIRRMPKARTTKSKSRIDKFHETRQKASLKTNKRKLSLDVNMSRLGTKVIDIDHMSKRFDDLVIMEDFSYKFRKGERIGIIGKNGSGKSTFLNLLAGTDQADEGEIEYGETVVMGYYRQEGISFDQEKRVIDAVKEIAEIIEAGSGSVLTASQFLQLFMFPPEMQYSRIAKLSGGEKRRLYLLTVLIRNPNFLILDEPTNDLDLITLNILEQFLADFKGCLILVSHDRFFLDKLSEHLFVFEGDGKIRDYYGPYWQYSEEKKLQESVKKESTRVPEKSAGKTEKSVPLNNAKLSFREKTEYEELEKEIEMLEKEKTELEKILNSGSDDFEKLQRASERVGEVIQILDEKSLRWLELDERA
ncbi:MAG: ABC-F family ATP-binding cassette domain-containing protein [Bacteroidota bacterium]